MERPPADRRAGSPEPVFRVFTVSEIADALRRTLEEAHGNVSVRGEISGLRRPGSGHLYFALKDEHAQLRAVMFRGSAIGLRFAPADGLEVEAEGEVTFYEPRGDLQLIVRRMVPSGVGALMQAFETLKRRLAAEGLFDPARKRPLPRFPSVIGIITSPTGAAIRDLIHVLRRRWPPARLVFHPVPVQGEGAALDIARALERMGRWGGADVIIVGRGGGSLEDLWAFNEEPVARAIAACPTPVVSAVGHEIDTTIADLVADLKAATPSAAAELVVPDSRELAAELNHLGRRLDRRLRTRLESLQQHLDRLVAAYGFRKPGVFLERRAQGVDELALRLERSLRRGLENADRRLQGAGHRLRLQHPRERVSVAGHRLRAASERLDQGVRRGQERRREGLAALERALRALDPGAVLGRGYSLIRDPAGTRVLRSARGLERGAPLLVQFQHDRAHVHVDRVETGGLHEPLPVRKGNDDDGKEEG